MQLQERYVEYRAVQAATNFHLTSAFGKQQNGNRPISLLLAWASLPHLDGDGLVIGLLTSPRVVQYKSTESRSYYELYQQSHRAPLQREGEMIRADECREVQFTTYHQSVDENTASLLRRRWAGMHAERCCP